MRQHPRHVKALPPAEDFADGRVQVDRRSRVRLQVRWPIFFLQPQSNELIETVTRDLSSEGLYCHSRATFVPGEYRECTLVLPTRNPFGQSMLPLFCKVRVIRVEPAGQDGWWGIGFHIEDYRILD